MHNQPHTAIARIDCKQSDGLVDTWKGHTLFDVCGVDNMCPTHLVTNKKKRTQACDNAASEKNNKYKEIATRKNVLFQPFVFTTLGGLHKTAVELINTITRQHPSKGPSKSKDIFNKLSELSMSIMRDNAAIIAASHRRSVQACVVILVIQNEKKHKKKI